MLNKIIKYTATVCIVSLLAFSANAEVAVDQSAENTTSQTDDSSEATKSMHKKSKSSATAKKSHSSDKKILNDF